MHEFIRLYAASSLFGGQESSIVDVKHTTQPRENIKSKFDRGIIWCAPRTFRGACGEASPSPRNIGNFRRQARQSTRICNLNGYKTRSRAADNSTPAAYICNKWALRRSSREQSIFYGHTGQRVGRIRWEWPGTRNVTVSEILLAAAFAGKEDWTGMGNSVEYFPQKGVQDISLASDKPVL